MTIQQLPVLDARVPKWDLSALASRDCPMCGGFSNTEVYARPDGLRVRKCSACLSFYVSPAPSPEQLDHFYSTYAQTHFTSVFATPEQLRGFLNNADPWADLRIQCLASHISLRGVSVLDVGCGRGEFLYLLQKLGADVTGVELDANAACIARQIGVREVHNKYLDRVDFETPFDVVVLNDVIEHPLKPIALLADVRKVLKDSGLLLIWTPSGDAPNTDPEKITFRVDLEHMQYLSTRTIQMIAQSGWEILHLETLGFPNLDGMSTPARSGLGLRGAIKRVLRNVPGLTRLRNLRNSLLLTRKERTGNYHLLTILRKRLQ